LILALLLLRRAFRNTVSRRVQYALWALVLVRLLVPGSLPAVHFSVLSVSEPAREQLEARLERQTPPPLENAFSEASEKPAAERAAKPVNVPSESTLAERLAGAAEWVWKLGAAAMACWMVLSNLLFWRKLWRTRTPVELPDCRYPVYVVEEGLRSPCLFGLFRPAIYLTPAAVASPEALRHVLAHEETHARHLDPVWSLLRSVCLAVYWFDPLVWWCAAVSRVDCELACDEGALERLGEAERIPYGRTLLALVPVKKGPGNPMLSATTMTAGKKRMKERITRIAEHRRGGVLALCLLLVLVAAACAATFTDGAASPAPAAASPAPSVIDREPVLTIPLTDLEPDVPPDGDLMEPDTVSVDTMGEVLVDKTLAGGTRVVCYWAPDTEYTKYWAIRDGGTLLRFYREESAYTSGYDVEEFYGLFGHDGFIVYAPRGGAYNAVDYWYLDGDGTPRRLVDCANETIRADWNGDGEDDLMWFYHTGPYLYFQREGTLYMADVCAMVQEAWPEAKYLDWDIPEDGPCLRICGYVEVPSEVLEGSSLLCAPRDLFFQGDCINLYKDPEPAVTDHVYDGIDVPEEVLAAARSIAQEDFLTWQRENPGGFDDWRISRLEPVETPTVSGKLKAGEIEIYHLNYEFHAASPGEVVWAGGTAVYEDGWVNGFYIEHQWLLFQVEDGRRIPLDAALASDAYPESRAFAAEFAWALTHSGVLRPSELESEALYLDFCWMPYRFLEELAGQPAAEQDAVIEALTDYVHGTAPEEYVSLYPTTMENLSPGELSAAALALYERLPAGSEGPKGLPAVVSKEDASSLGTSLLPPAESGGASIDPLDYGITPEMLNLQEVPSWEEMGVGALCAYYLHSDGAGSEGSSDTLYRRFLEFPDEVLSHLANLGDQAARREDRTAAEELCQAIASADVFWYDSSPEYAAVLENARETYPDGPVAAVLDTLRQEHDAAIARSRGGF